MEVIVHLWRRRWWWCLLFHNLASEWKLRLSVRFYLLYGLLCRVCFCRVGLCRLSRRFCCFRCFPGLLPLLIGLLPLLIGLLPLLIGLLLCLCLLLSQP